MPVLPQLPTLWVSAAPFRYHVHHLMAATGVPWQVMAVVADLPQQQVRSLLYGRDGRRRSRLSPYAARRLLALDATQLRRLQVREIPAHLVMHSVHALLADGASLESIARWLRLDLHSTSQLAAGAGSFTQTHAIMLHLACVHRGLLMEPEARAVA
ncbi:MAG TPA: hypothetical protein VIL68_01910 [Propionibacteriaceae bacterium]